MEPQITQITLITLINKKILLKTQKIGRFSFVRVSGSRHAECPFFILFSF